MAEKFFREPESFPTQGKDVQAEDDEQEEGEELANKEPGTNDRVLEEDEVGSEIFVLRK